MSLSFCVVSSLKSKASLINFGRSLGCRSFIIIVGQIVIIFGLGRWLSLGRWSWVVGGLEFRSQSKATQAHN